MSSPSTLKLESPPAKAVMKNLPPAYITPPHRKGPSKDEFQFKSEASFKEAMKVADWKDINKEQKRLKEKYPIIAGKSPS